MPDATSTKATLAAGAGAGAVAIAALALAVTGLKNDEGKRNATYLDIATMPTACYGHTGADVRLGQRYSDIQCEGLLSKDAGRALSGVLRCTPGLAVRQYQLAAATRFAFNAGVGAYCSSSIAYRFNRGEWRRGCDRLLAWNKARVKGRLVAVPGLAARRLRERTVCLTGVPA